MTDHETRGIATLDRLLELTVVLNADMQRHFDRQGLTPSRTHLLWQIHHRGPSTQRALAEALDVSARNVTGLVDAMVETGFLIRRPHPTDRRAALVTLTDRGAEAARSLERGQAELAAHLFGDLPEDELERFGRHLEGTLRRLQDAMAEAEVPAEGRTAVEPDRARPNT